MANLPVLYELQDGIGLLTLNNPERRNALSTDTLTALEGYLDDIRGDRTVSVVIIRAEGKVFSSGHDLRELTKGTEEDYARVFALSTNVMEAIRLLPQPVIAQVQGLATASGCQLVAACDLAVAAEDAAFATPGVQIGLFCTTPGVALARAVPRKKAMEMLLTGKPISAEEALECGLVNRVVPPEELVEQTLALARQIASASSETVAMGKAAFYRQVEVALPDAYVLAEKAMVDNLRTDDAREGIDAFLSKRPPRWSA